MENLPLSPFLLALIFFAIALTYSAVGLGGGSSYIALMSIFGMSYLLIPSLSLSLNLFVTTSGSINFIRYDHARLKLILPFLITSIPFTYIGGAISVSKEIFYWILLISLIFVALRIFFWKNSSLQLKFSKGQKIALSLFFGTLLGLIAGIVGIGGGIYLVPIIILLGLGTHQEAAACGAIFVWINSAVGLLARIQHQPISPLIEFIPIIISVLLGGMIGSYLGASKLNSQTMEKVQWTIILIAIFFLIQRF